MNDQLAIDLLGQIAGASSLEALEAVRITTLSKSGSVTAR